MKKVLLAITMLGVLSFLSACDKESSKTAAATNLPWKVSTTANGATHVLGVDIGETTFKQLMFKLRLLAEPALFETAEGNLFLEASFGKKKFGVLEARLIAEMEADQTVFKAMKEDNAGRDSTPSNHWKYSLSVKSTKIANDLRVWRLVYLPVADFELKQMQFFGEPQEKVQVTDNAQYWLYPDKGMALLWDKEGKEIFYYAAPKDFTRLKKSLPTKVVIVKP
ncbi:MAG: hypothetical protein L3J51_07595 [Cocleimonas sp.]|nr:hypothetical protein [Cocleimonas sp.]